MKKYEVKGETVVAACDKELLGRVFREGALILDLGKYSKFYVGEVASEPELIAALKGATSVNLVGERAVSCAFKARLAKKGDERRIEGIHYLQIYRL